MHDDPTPLCPAKRMTRTSLAALREAHERGEGGVGKDAPPRDAFDTDFWDDAVASLPPHERLGGDLSRA